MFVLFCSFFFWLLHCMSFHYHFGIFKRSFNSVFFYVFMKKVFSYVSKMPTFIYDCVSNVELKNFIDNIFILSDYLLFKFNILEYYQHFFSSCRKYTKITFIALTIINIYWDSITLICTSTNLRQFIKWYRKWNVTSI